MIIKKTLSVCSLLMCFSTLHAGAEIFNFDNLDMEFLSDKSEYTLDLCHCSIKEGKGGAGLKTRIVEPVGVQESTNTPWKLVALGANAGEAGSMKQGASRGDGANKRFNHFYAFAPFAFLNFIQDEICFENLSTLGTPYFSEIIPTQNNDILAGMAQMAKGPTGKAWYSNPIAALLSLVDCTMTTFKKSVNSLSFTAGCAGVTGNNTSFGNGRANDPIMAHHVAAAIELDDLYFAGIIAKTSNANFTISPIAAVPNSMCTPKYFPTIVKSENYIQDFIPTVWSAQRIGMFRTFHADFKNKPGSGDDVASWLWKVKDFCAGAMKCKSMYPKNI